MLERMFAGDRSSIDFDYQAHHERESQLTDLRLEALASMQQIEQLQETIGNLEARD